MDHIEKFQGWTKIPRFNRPDSFIITEKIDGTNAQISIAQIPETMLDFKQPPGTQLVLSHGATYLVRVASRKRWISPEHDNFGFARWAYDNASKLVGLGPGRHYGEWYGKGIQRGYGLDHKRFALFNVLKWGADGEHLPEDSPHTLTVVPEIDRCAGRNLNQAVNDSLQALRTLGSFAVGGFKKPEGLVIHNSENKATFKVLMENDDLPKSLVAA